MELKTPTDVLITATERADDMNVVTVIGQMQDGNLIFWTNGNRLELRGLIENFRDVLTITGSVEHGEEKDFDA